MRLLSTVFLLTAFVIILSCTVEIEKPDIPDCVVLITNGGVFTMDVSVESVGNGSIEHKYVEVGETKSWYLYVPVTGGCSFFEGWEGYVRATYVDPTLSNGGFSEEKYWISVGTKKEIMLKDCPGWQF